VCKFTTQNIWDSLERTLVCVEWLGKGVDIHTFLPVGEGAPGSVLLSASLRPEIQLDELPRTNHHRQSDGHAVHQQAGGQSSISSRCDEEDLGLRSIPEASPVSRVHQHAGQQAGRSPVKGVRQPQHRAEPANDYIQVSSASLGTSGDRLLRGDGEPPTAQVHGSPTRPLLDTDGLLREDLSSEEAVLFPTLQLGAAAAGQVGKGKVYGPGDPTFVAITPVLADHVDDAGSVSADTPARSSDPSKGTVQETRISTIPDDRLSALRREWGEGAFSDAAWKFRFNYFDKNSPQGDSRQMRKYQRYFQLYPKFLAAGTCDAAQFSAPSLVTAAGWAREQGLLTWSQFDGFFTAFNEMHQLRFGTTLAELRPIKDSRKSAKKMVVPRRSPALTPYYPDPALVIHSWGTNPKFWSTSRLRQRTCYSLHGDIIGRGGESTKAVRWGLKFNTEGVRGLLWNTKTAKGVMTPFSARHCCKIFKPGRCTPCLLLEGLAREKLAGIVAEKDIDCSPLMDGDQPLFTAGLFLCSQKTASTGLFKSLGPQRISKLIKRSMDEADFDSHWRSHDVRGMVASKLVNMGCPEQTVTLRARFSLETFRKHYYKFVQYAEKSDSVTKLEFEHILRIKTTILS
jgi:hypothetical protein